MNKALILYYYARKIGATVRHSYTANRIDFDINDIRNARVVEVKKAVPDKKDGISLPNYEFQEQEDEPGKVSYRYAQPYPGFGADKRDGIPKKGFGNEFRVKVLEHLLTKLPGSTKVSVYSPNINSFDAIRKAGLSLEGNTLQEFYVGFKGVADANRVKYEHKQRE